MSIPAPSWITFSADKTQGLDLLGLRAPVQSIGNGLLNGLTSVTPKLHYLSIQCWIIWRYLEARLPNDSGTFQRFAAAQEATIAMAGVMRDSKTVNIVGANKARALVNSKNQVLPLKPLVRNIAFNIYASANRQLSLTLESGSGVDGLTRERGLQLAQAFDASIAATAYSQRLAKRPKLDRLARRDVEELSEILSLVVLTQREKTILINAILPTQPVDAAERQRLATFSLLLWLSSHRAAIPNEYDVFRAASRPPPKLPATFDDTLDGWLRYTIRDLIAVTHETVLAAVMTEVDAGSARNGAPPMAESVVTALLEAIDEHNDILRQVGLLRMSESVRRMSFNQIADRVAQLCNDGETLRSGLRRWRGGLSESDLYDNALQAGAASAALLPVAWCLAAHRVSAATPGADKASRELLSIGEVFQIGLQDVILPQLQEYRQRNPPFLEVMSDLIVRTVQQHLRVAWSRFATPTGKDVSVLIADLESWARNNGFAAGRTESRLAVAISWLQQLALVSEDGITASGQRVLDRALATLERA